MTRFARRAALGLLGMGAVGCGGSVVRHVPPPDPLALVPARTLALVPADLPGFRLLEELSPSLSATGLEDPYGRLGAYAATYAPLASPPGDVTCSVNTYAGSAHARSAFDAWQAAVPRQYASTVVTLGLPDGDSVGFERDGAVLLGFRVRNVLASVRAPQARAAELARLVIARIERSAH